MSLKALRQKATVQVVAASLLSMALLASLARGGYPGAANGCFARDTCFCEATYTAVLHQPINTASCAAFIGAGWWMARRMDNHPGQFPMRWFPVLVALVGPASMALHAAMTVWGGQADVISMYAFVGHVASHAATRAFCLPTTWRTRLWLSVVVALSALKLWGDGAWVSSDVLFGALIALLAVFELGIAKRRRDLIANHRFLLLAGVCFGLGGVLWHGSRSSHGWLCEPSSWAQGHAAWHLLCAAACIFLFLFYASERPAPPGHPPVTP